MWLSVFPHPSPLSALLPSFLPPFYTSFLLFVPSLFLRWQSYCVAQASLYWAFWCGVEHVPLNLQCVFVQHIDHSFPSSIKKKINGKRLKTEVLCFSLAVDFCFSWKHQSNLQLGFPPRSGNHNNFSHAAAFAGVLFFPFETTRVSFISVIWFLLQFTGLECQGFNIILISPFPNINKRGL